jgi:hypothetical protein
MSLCKNEYSEVKPNSVLLLLLLLLLLLKANLEIRFELILIYKLKISR